MSSLALGPEPLRAVSGKCREPARLVQDKAIAPVADGRDARTDAADALAIALPGPGSLVAG